MAKVIDVDADSAPGGDAPRTDLGAHLLKLIEETHRNQALQTAMLADLYNLVFFNLRPKQPAIPPNPAAVPARPTGGGALNVNDLAAIANALGGLFRGR